MKIDQLLKAREENYGKFSNGAAISQCLKLVMQQCPSWEALEYDQREALGMIAHKVARILNGDPGYIDSWVDIAGYAQLVAGRLELDDGQQDEPPTAGVSPEEFMARVSQR